MHIAAMPAQEAAISTSFQDLRAPLHRYIAARVRQPEIAEDLVQDVLLKASSHLHTLRTGAALPGWLFQIARRRVADHFRSARDTVEFQEATHTTAPAPLEDPDETALHEGLTVYIRSVVEGLPPIYRDALLATEYAGHTQAELARSAGITLPAAKSRVQRARALLRAEMERCCRWQADKYGHVIEVTPRHCGCAEK
jgi:RNA polymerase sigma-70 factor (ECF subfamily)